MALTLLLLMDDRKCFQEMATLLRNGILAKEPEVTLSGEVECDEVYIVAGHKGNPESRIPRQSKKNEKGVGGV